MARRPARPEGPYERGPSIATSYNPQYYDPSSEPAETISLYLDLEPGKKADFEVVGQAAAAFAELVREVAYVLEPGLDVSLEFEESEEGSLSLKGILKAVKSKDGRTVALLAVIVTVAASIGGDIKTYGIGKLLDWYVVPEQRQNLSDEDIERIAKAVENVRSGRIAKEPTQKVFREVNRDPKIRGIGATTRANKKPLAPVPRSEFPIRAGIAPQPETTPKRRKSKSKDRLTLISPVLLLTDRVWRFRSTYGEFGYHMNDAKFLSDLLSGKRPMTMKEGIQITAEIETHEEFTGNVWIAKERHITKVIGTHRKPKQSDLFTQPKKRKPSKKKKR